MAARLVVVTGATSGIGRASAERFARAGARVVLLARNAGKLDEVVQGILRAGGSAAAYPVDLSDSGEVEAVTRRLLDEQGVPAVLVNNAGAGRWLPLVKTPLAEARTMVEVPYLAAFYMTRMLLPAMIARGHGRVAFVTSPASYMVWPDACGYIAARQALKGLAEALRTEVRGTGIGVTLVTLGTVASPYWQHNPGSREHLPRTIPLLMPELTVAEAAETVVRAIDRNEGRCVRPWFYRVLFFLGATG